MEQRFTLGAFDRDTESKRTMAYLMIMLALMRRGEPA